MEEETISISEIIQIIKSKWKIIIIVTLTATIISALYSFFLVTPVYTSRLKVFIGKDTMEKKEYSTGDVTLYQNLLKTYSELITTDDLIEKAVEKSHLDVLPEAVAGGLSVSQGEETQIMTIKYRNANSILSKDVLDAVTQEFIKEAKELIPNGSVKVVESSKYPIYPGNLNSIRNILMGIIVGAFLGITLVLFMEYISNTFKTREQIETSIGIPVIGLIPHIGEEK